ncbi:unnamed protein product [Mytilus coruscus]|uniref:Uncharacterized protein n=1 Tax=Mytilus coruscus TaxID=42192 RepID=A0A6J8C687_MYTCO|nr:unnamed protein product [Mytilus coruscus]
MLADLNQRPKDDNRLADLNQRPKDDNRLADLNQRHKDDISINSKQVEDKAHQNGKCRPHLNFGCIYVMAQSAKVINKGKVGRICTLSWKLSHGLNSAAANNQEFKRVAGIKENAQHVVHLLYEFELVNDGLTRPPKEIPRSPRSQSCSPERVRRPLSGSKSGSAGRQHKTQSRITCVREAWVDPEKDVLRRQLFDGNEQNELQNRVEELTKAEEMRGHDSKIAHHQFRLLENDKSKIKRELDR